MKECIGCGVQLQNNDKKAIGYTPKLDVQYCQRCFRIMHYDDLTISLKQGIPSEDVIAKINNLDALIVWVVDLFDFESNMIKHLNQFLVGKDMLFVGSKRDLLPDTLSNEKLSNFILRRLRKYHINVKGIVVIGEMNAPLAEYNNSIKELAYAIDYYRDGRDVAIIGLANAGKSSLLNHFIKQQQLTTSRYPGTTVDVVKIPFDDYCIYDTPGITKDDSLLTHIDESILKAIVPNKQVKPTIFQLSKDQTLSIAGLVRIDLIGCENLSAVAYFKNELVVHRGKFINADHLWETQLNQLLTPSLDTKFSDMKHLTFDKVDGKKDIVIHGLGWLCIVGKVEKIEVYVNKKIAVSIREGMI